MTTDRTSSRVDGLAQRLIHRAARHAPAEISERLEEEWLADSSERRAGLARLRFALGCCWATRVIAFEHARAALPAGAAGNGGAIGYFQPETPLFSRRSVTFLLVVGLHGAVLYGLVVGIATTYPKLTVDPLVPQIEPRHAIPLPPPPEPQIQRTHIILPNVENTLPVEKGGDTSDKLTPGDPRELVPPSPPPHTVSRVPGGPGAGFPNTDDFYPSPSIWAREQGVATVNVCVDSRGGLTSVPTLAQPTGFTRLDQAALRLARAGSGHYRASTEDGKPVNACYAFRIRFNLRG